MTKKYITPLVSLALSAALVSGIDVISTAASAFILIITVICYLLVPLIALYAKELAKKVDNGWYKWPIAITQWAALLYAGHPYVFAASVVLAIIVTIIFNASKEED